MKIRTRLRGPLSLLSLIVLLACFISCASSKHEVSRNSKVSQNGKGGETPWLPKDFNPKESTLLIAEFPLRGQNRKMQDYVKENYPFKYEFVSPTVVWYHEGDTGVYADKKLYRYCLVRAAGGSFNASQTHTLNGWDFCIYDRGTKRSYPPTRKEGSFAMIPFKFMINSIVDKYK